METFVLKPLEGAGKVKLGSKRTENVELLGEPNNRHGERDYYELNGYFFSLHYSTSDALEFIEFSKMVNARVELYGISVFETQADSLIKLITDKSGTKFDSEEPEIPYCYIFPQLELAFWRPVIPADSEDDEGQFFSTVGIGIKGYYTELM